jgi:TPR repeat protein
MRLRFFKVSDPQTDPTARIEPGAGAGAAKACLTPALAHDAAEQNASETANEQPRFALLIGNGRYRHQALVNPGNDVRLLDWALKGIGFKVSVLENATLASMRTALIAFAETIDAAGPESVAMIYFAGHGIQHEGRSYLLPVEADIPSSRYLSARALAIDVIFEELSRTSRKANIVVVDACRINPFLDNDAAPERVFEGLMRQALPRPTQIVYSTSARRAAEDGARANSPFAEALVEEIPGLLTQGRRIQDAFDDTAVRVAQMTAGRQIPAMYREGILPPLTLSPRDEMRLRDWSRRPRRWTSRQIAAGLAAGIAAAAMLAAGLTWWSAYPETRATWLLRAGLKDKAAYDFTCAAPWDDVRDRFGLTRRDWCLKLDLGARTIFDFEPRTWENEVSPAFAEGDPKAVVLMAMQALARAVRGGLSDDEALKSASDLADRAARTDVPLGKVLPMLARYAGAGPTTSYAKLDLNFSEISAQIRGAARDGLLLGRILTLQLDGSYRPAAAEIERRSAAIEAVLNEADGDDATGEVAYYGHQIFAGRAAFSTAYLDKRRADSWLARAVKKHWPAAAEDYLHLELQGGIPLQPELRRRLIEAVIAAGGPAGDFWAVRRLIETGSADAGPEIVTRLQRAARAGHTAAMDLLADQYLSPAPGGTRDIKAGLALLEDAAGRGSNLARIRLGLLLIAGLGDADGGVLVEPNPEAGRRLLDRADMDGDIRATGHLADVLRAGPLVLRDPDRARQLYVKVATTLPLPNLSSHARREIDNIDRALLLKQEAGTVDEPAIGPDDAAVEVHLFIAPSCIGCDTRLHDELQATTRMFLNAGGVRFILRIVAAFDQPADVDAVLLTQCVAPALRYTVLKRLIERHGVWSQAADQQARQAAMESAIETQPLARPSVSACLADAGNRSAVAARQTMAQRLLMPPPDREPFAIVNGRIVIPLSGHRLEAVILQALPPRLLRTQRP